MENYLLTLTSFEFNEIGKKCLGWSRKGLMWKDNLKVFDMNKIISKSELNGGRNERDELERE